MWIDIQMGPIVMWAWWLVWVAAALVAVAGSGIAIYNRLTKNASKASAIPWILYATWMARNALHWGNKVAYWFCQAWPDWCG